MSRFCDSIDLGIEHLSSLAHLQVETDCDGATLDEVEAVEGSVEKAIALCILTAILSKSISAGNMNIICTRITRRGTRCLTFLDDKGEGRDAYHFFSDQSNRKQFKGEENTFERQR
jgi:hypothetical protein